MFTVHYIDDQMCAGSSAHNTYDEAATQDARLLAAGFTTSGVLDDYDICDYATDDYCDEPIQQVY